MHIPSLPLSLTDAKHKIGKKHKKNIAWGKKIGGPVANANPNSKANTQVSQEADASVPHLQMSADRMPAYSPHDSEYLQGAQHPAWVPMEYGQQLPWDGYVYYQQQSWGGCQPLPEEGMAAYSSMGGLGGCIDPQGQWGFWPEFPQC